MAIETLNIEDLDRNGLQTRVALDEATVVEYSEAMRGKAHFPPVTAFCDGTKIYLADGFHRVEATLRCGWKKIKADVREGTFADALKHALGANANHGLRRTNADKQRCLQLAWENRRALFGELDPTADWLAETCGVSSKSAQRFYDQISDNVRDLTPQRTNATGRVYTIPTRPPTRTPPPPVRQVPSRTSVKSGYHIGTDGKTHADGVILDRFGVEIPERIRTAFSSEFLNGVISQLQAARTMLKRAQDDKDICVAAVSQRARLEMENAYHELKAAKPFCVCRMCQGQGCAACKETGFQTEDQFNRNPPEMNP